MKLGHVVTTCSVMVPHSALGSVWVRLFSSICSARLLDKRDAGMCSGSVNVRGCEAAPGTEVVLPPKNSK